MRTAFMILARHQLSMLARLIKRLQHPEVLFVVHIDAKVDEAPFREALIDQPNVTFIDARVRVFWFDYSVTRAILRLLDVTWTLGAERFTLISGQYYPVRSVDGLLREIARDEEIIAVDRRCERVRQTWFDRCAFEPFFGDNRLLSRRDAHWLMRKLSSAAGRALRRRRSPMPVYYGPTWWALTRAGAAEVRRFAAERPNNLA